MAVTVEQVIQRLRRHFEEADATTIIDYINEVHSDLLTLLPMVADSTDLTLVVGQREYTIAETIVRVWSAHYYVSATDIRALLPTDKDELDVRSPNWRTHQNSIPSRFYVDRNTTDLVVGLSPSPSVATSGTYPFVRLYTTTEATLTRSSSLPKGIATMDTYVYGAMRRYTASDPKIYGHWDMLYQQALQSEIAKYHGMNVQKNPSIIPSWIPRGGVI